MSTPAMNTPAALFEKIKDVRICMFTTLSASGHLKSHPMTRQKIDASGALWFFTSDKTGLAKDISGNAQVNLSFTEPENSLFISASGAATQVKDRAKIKDLWNPIVAAWFPEGLEDPHLTLIKVDLHGAEYWDNKSSHMVQLFEMVSAAVTGNPPKAEPGEHGTVKL